MMIYCQPSDCDNCPYTDCIGTIRKKPGRKKLPPDVLLEHRRTYSRNWYYEHRDEQLIKKREKYQKLKDEKKNS